MSHAIESRVGGIRDNLLNSGLHFSYAETCYSVKIEVKKALIPHKENSWQPFPQITQPPPNYLTPDSTLHVGPPGFSRIIQPPNNLPNKLVESPRLKSLENEKTVADEKIKTLEAQISRVKNEVSISQAERKTSQAQIDQLGKANATLDFQVCEAKNVIIRIQSEKTKSEANLQAQIAQLKERSQLGETN